MGKRFEAHNATAGEMCSILGISEHALRQLIEQGMPVRPGRRGQAHSFDAREAVAWHMNRAVAAAHEPDTALVELARLRKSQRELLDVRVEQMRDSLLPRQDAERAWQAIGDMFRLRMAQVLDDAAGRGWGEHVLDELEASLAEALAELTADPLARHGD